MRTLELESYGVEEISLAEKRETDGGFWGKLAWELVKSAGGSALWDGIKYAYNNPPGQSNAPTPTTTDASGAPEY